MRICPVKVCLLILAVWTIRPELSLAQQFPLGLPDIKNFSSKDYQWHPKNFSVVQGNKGLIYVGNSYGILEYDGKVWRKILLPNGLDGHVLGVNEQDQVLVGTFGEFGRLVQASIGTSDYESLSSSVNLTEENPGEIIGIWSYKDQIIFSTQLGIWQYKRDTLVRLVNKPNGLGYTKVIGNFLYFQEEQRLIRWDLEQELAPATYPLEFKLAGLFTTSNDTMAISANGHILSLVSSEIKRISHLSQDFIINRVIRLQSDGIALASTNRGLIILDSFFDIIHHIDSKQGLLSDKVLDLFEDREGNLWLALDNGISHITLNAPFTHYGQANGIRGMGYTSAMFRNQLFLGTSQGVFTHNNSGKFAPVKDSEGQIYELQSIGSQLLIAHESGLFQFSGGKNRKISGEQKVWCIRRIPGQNDQLLIGTDVGLSLINLKNQDLQLSPILNGFSESSRVIAFDSDQKLWVCHGNKGLFRLTLDWKQKEVTEVEFYSQDIGNLPVYVSHVSPSKNGLLFSTENGVYQFDQASKTFYPHEQINAFLKHNYYVDKIVEGTFGSLWIIQDNKITKLDPLDNGSYALLPENIITELTNNLVGSYEHLYVYDSNNVIIGTQDGFAQFNVHNNINYRINSKKQPDRTIIRKVEFQNPDSSFHANIQPTSPLVLTHDFNNVTLTYAPGFYQSREEIRFSFFLENDQSRGEPDWSDWYVSNQTSFKNLAPGRYTFYVRSRGDSFKTSESATYQFVIQSPWYTTRTSIIIYTLCIIAIGLTIYKIRVGKIKEEKREALSQKDEELRQQKLIAESEKVKLINERLKEKVALKNKELGSVALEITKKNEFLGQLKKNLTQLATLVSNDGSQKLRRSIRSIDQNMRSDNNWERFELYFDESHQDFIRKLKEKQPDLTKSSINLCAFLKLDLSTKEIASLMNISVSGVEKRRYRLRKKLNLDTDINLKEYLESI